MKESIGFTEGFLLGSGIDHGNKKDHKVFDWIKAARLIKGKCMVGNMFDCNQVVSAGLMEDWTCTGGEIFKQGAIVDEDDTYVYLSSSWATPILDIDGEEFECWVLAGDTSYESRTYWPEEAIYILYDKDVKKLENH